MKIRPEDLKVKVSALGLLPSLPGHPELYHWRWRERSADWLRGDKFTEGVPQEHDTYYGTEHQPTFMVQATPTLKSLSGVNHDKQHDFFALRLLDRLYLMELHQVALEERIATLEEAQRKASFENECKDCSNFSSRGY